MAIWGEKCNFVFHLNSMYGYSFINLNSLFNCMKRVFAKTLVLMVSLCLSAFVAMAQGTITGKIVDANTGDPLIGATVMVEGTTQGCVADVNGEFSLQVSKKGNIQLLFRFVGYESLVKSVNVNRNIKLGEVGLLPESIGLGDVTVTASVAVQRKTPVAVAVIDPIAIEHKLSTQEFPEIMKSTPGIYATKQGGGFGDSRVNLRGFENENIAVMVNGVPMNEMEWGGIYWSNWSGLSDVTRSMQVQRGLGASKVAAPSVGGSINVITNTTDVKPGGAFSYGIGNDGYNKLSFNVSSGLKNGWAISLLGSKTWGNGYIQGTEFDGYTYFGNISKQINANHMLSLTIFGSPQKHNQRKDDLLITEWQKQQNKYKYNAAYGYGIGGERKVSGHNVYHKPQISLNHSWNINEKSSLSTALYASFGRGYGYSGQGYTSDYRYKWYGTSKEGTVNTEFRAADGTFDYEQVYTLNKNSQNGSMMAMAKNINNHNWFGLLSTYTTQLGDYFNVYGGLDIRYYKGVHKAELIDLYGGEYFIDYNSRKNVAYKKNDVAWQNEKLKVGDVVYRNYDGYVAQEGIFGQVEFNRNALSVFVAGSVSHSLYWREDHFYYDKDNAKSDKAGFWGGTVKGGANYNLNELHNVFVNIGYISRAPFFADGVFLQKETSNELNEDAVNEKVFSVELGYGFRSSFMTANLNLYRTAWLDKAMASGVSFSRTEERGLINMTGVDALHQGIELELEARLCKTLKLNGMLSLGDWEWNSNAEGYIYNSQGQPLDKNGEVASGMLAEDHAKVGVDLKGVKVGNSAQTTFAFGANWEVLKGLRLGADYTHWTRNYAKFKIQGSDLEKNIGKVIKYETPWKIPSAGSMDVNMSYRFPLGKVWGTISANVNNVLDQEYITDAEDGKTHDWKTAQVYYGFGRTYSVRLKISF